ncbi:MAG: putative rane protein [Ramlibacter sp.]|nr:putative rane protein [Ramlibacter sp.]
MEFIVEVIAQFLFELLLQIIGQFLFELGLHAIAEPFRKAPNPWVAALGYVLLGVILGALTLWPFPSSMVKLPILRWVNLALTPVLVGVFMSWLGNWRARRGQFVMRIDRFSYGYLFALTVALVRFTWAH